MSESLNHYFMTGSKAGTSEVFLTQSWRVTKQGQRHSRGTEGAVATLHCSSAGPLGGFQLFSRTHKCRLTNSIQVFSVFHTLLLNVVCLLLCRKERQRREKKGLSAYKYSHQSHQSQHYWLSVCLHFSSIDLGYIIRVFSGHECRKGGGTLNMLLSLKPETSCSIACCAMLARRSISML